MPGVIGGQVAQLGDLPGVIGGQVAQLGDLPGVLLDLPGVIGGQAAQLGDLPGVLRNLPGILRNLPGVLRDGLDQLVNFDRQLRQLFRHRQQLSAQQLIPQGLPPMRLQLQDAVQVRNVVNDRRLGHQQLFPSRGFDHVANHYNRNRRIS